MPRSLTSTSGTPAPTLVSFLAGPAGPWRIDSIMPITGPTLPLAPRLQVLESASTPEAAWTLRGVVSNLRYTTAAEAAQLAAKQDPLSRPQATRAALIPIRKSPAWWALEQDARRALLEEQGRHISIGLDYLPAIARRLLHCRDLASGEPFDFLTWFEWAPEHTSAFDELLTRLRASPEWGYVDREVEIRLSRES